MHLGQTQEKNAVSARAEVIMLGGLVTLTQSSMISGQITVLGEPIPGSF